MAGFTAPKLAWVHKHEPRVFAKVAKVLLPKDYVRYRMTGDYASDMSDSSGTLWLDIAGRKWSPAPSGTRCLLRKPCIACMTRRVRRGESGTAVRPPSHS